MILRTLLFLLAPLVLASMTLAHDVWIEPGPGAIELGSLVEVELWQGHVQDAEPLPRNEKKLERFQALAPDGEAVDLPGLHGQRPAGLFRPERPGTWSLIYEGRPSLHRLGPEHFERYLQQEGLGHVLEQRRRLSLEGEAGSELVSRSLKALVTVGDRQPSGPQIVDRPVGLAVELVLERWTHSQVELRLLVDGEPAEGVLVDLQRLDAPSQTLAVSLAGRLQQARSDADGAISFSLSGSSHGARWMAAAVVAKPSSSPDARWRTIFATLTFAAETFAAASLAAASLAAAGLAAAGLAAEDAVDPDRRDP